MIDPPPPAIITGRAYLHMSMVPRALTAMTRSQSSVDISKTPRSSFSPLSAALLSSMSSRPKFGDIECFALIGTGYLLYIGLGQIADHHPNPVRGQAPSGRRPDGGGAAADKRDFAFERVLGLSHLFLRAQCFLRSCPG